MPLSEKAKIFKDDILDQWLVFDGNCKYTIKGSRGEVWRGRYNQLPYSQYNLLLSEHFGGTDGKEKRYARMVVVTGACQSGYSMNYLPGEQRIIISSMGLVTEYLIKPKGKSAFLNGYYIYVGAGMEVEFPGFIPSQGDNNNPQSTLLAFAMGSIAGQLFCEDNFAWLEDNDAADWWYEEEGIPQAHYGREWSYIADHFYTEGEDGWLAYHTYL